MSIQDDIFDVEAALEGKSEIESFERLLDYLNRLEAGNDALKDALGDAKATIRMLTGRTP